MIAAVAIAAALLGSAAAVRSPFPFLNGGVGVTPVTSFNATKYLGFWYQTYADAFVDNTFERDNFCVGAVYGINSNGTVSVHNRARIGSVSGPLSEIYGYAVPTSTPGYLTVYLQGVPVGAPYIIFALGPETYGSDGQYQWALVSDSFNLSLFVLARNATDYMNRYDAGVQKILAANNFTNFLNKPTLTVQQGCVPY